ncbi:MAG: DMT family transporter [Cyanobacteria bacterium P01_F01_bin.53]
MVLSVIGGAVASSFSSFSATSFKGEIAALTAAFLWAAATLMFGRLGRSLSPLVLNIVKGIFAIALILITLLVRSRWIDTTTLPTTLPTTNNLPITAMVYLLLSGGIGIGLGDTAYFSAINALGARRALLLETLAPPMTAGLAWIFLSEQLPFMAIAGILMTLLGVAWVISERVPATDSALAKKSQNGWQTGLSVALLAVFCQASGAVLSRAALVNVAVDPLWSSLLRLLAGMAFMGMLAALQPRRLGDYCPEPELKEVATIENAPAKRDWRVRWQKSLTMLRSPRLLVGVALAAFFGTYLGIWLQQIALKNTAAGIAQALLATSPLFVLPMAALLGDRISYRAIAGVAIALGGVWLLFYVA